MNWDNVRFSSTDMIMILTNVIMITSFLLFMKNDIHALLNEQQRLESVQNKQDEGQRSFQERSEKSGNDINVRISLLEQKVMTLESDKNRKH